MLTLCAVIWGTSLVPQKLGTPYLGLFSPGTAQFLTGAIIFFPLSLILERINKGERKLFLQKDLAVGGGLCGTAMFSGVYFQQLGLTDMTMGKTGFITATYIIIIPLIGLSFHHKIETITWVSIALTAVGLYFSCISENFSISRGDFYVFIGSLFWAVQIALVDTCSKRIDSLELVLIESVVTDSLSLFYAFQMESPDLQSLTTNVDPILYTGIMVIGVAHTFQVLGQKTVPPTTAGLVLNTESLFGVASGALMPQEVMSLREICGCILMFGALMLTQTKLPIPQKLLPGATPAAPESSSTPDKQLQTPATQSVKSE